MGKFKARGSRNKKRIDDLPWNSAVLNDDPFSMFTGNGPLEGGFLSLEEIDESLYMGMPESENQVEEVKPGKSSETKKRKRVGKDGELDGEEKTGEVGNLKEQKKMKSKKKVKKQVSTDEDKIGGVNMMGEEGNVEERKSMKRKTKKRKQVSADGDQKDGKIGSEKVVGDEGKVKDQKTMNSSKKAKQAEKQVPEKLGEDGELCVDEDEFNAWVELRLHPLLMKAIYQLGFKEPTPIQKACIPAAAHQGKDVIGAAETGSGKTLAFGLPILQRLLQELDKVENLMIDGEAAERISPRGFIRALIITPTRELALQVAEHLKAAARSTRFRVVSIVGGMSTEKQERLLRARPEIVVGTPGRLWELMSGGEKHLVELHSLSFFVLDEADRMIENGHFRELQSIIDMLPVTNGPIQEISQDAQNGLTASCVPRKKRQTFVFSATIALSSDFRKKLKRGSLKSNQTDGLSSLETLSERAGMRPDAAIVDLTNSSIMASNLEESFLECREEDKDAYLYYILCVHGLGRTIVFCTSIAALRHVSALLRLVNISVHTIHAKMQQRARLKAMDRFRESENGILVATDVFARGLDIPGVRTVIHYQLPHSAEVYVHRSGRTARASLDGCSVALISPNDRLKFATLCKSFAKDSLLRFPVESSYMAEVMKRLSLARQIDKISRKDSREKGDKSWFKRNAESVGLVVDDDDSEEERVKQCKQKKATSTQLKKLQQELAALLSRPLQSKYFSRRYLAGAGVSPQLQHQLEELAHQKLVSNTSSGESNKKVAVIGQDCVEPLQALRKAGPRVCMDVKEDAGGRRKLEDLRRKRKQEKRRRKEEKRKERKKLKEAAQ